MNNKCDRAIVLMAIGKRYEAQLNFVLPQFEQYAKFCKADLQVVREAPDPANTHSLLIQKMLIPSLFTQYDVIAFFDLDVFLSKLAPSIFDYLPTKARFSACTSPRGETGFNNMFRYHHNLPDKIHESHVDYFADRGFDLTGIDPDRLYSINGGAWVARPKMISGLLREAYFCISSMKKNNKNFSILSEEELMAYTTQKNNLFQPLDQRFNKQILYSIYEDPRAKISSIRNDYKYIFLRHVNKINMRPFFLRKYIAPKYYILYIENLLKENYVVHFAGGFEYLGIKPKGSYLS